MAADDFPGDGKSQPRAAVVARSGRVAAVEALEDAFQVRGGNRRARVFYRDDDRRTLTGRRDRDASPGIHVPDRVRHDIGKHLEQPVGIGLDRGQPGLDIHSNLDALG